MWFDPLNNNEDPEKIGLRLYSENYDETNQINFLAAAYIVLDNILGEKANAMNIDYIELQVPSLSQKEDSIELVKLPRYIEWFKSKNKR